MEIVKKLLLVLFIAFFSGCIEPPPTPKILQNFLSAPVEKKEETKEELSDIEKLKVIADHLMENEFNGDVQKSMNKAFSFVYGKPYIDKNMTYNTSSRSFSAFVKSTKGNFNKEIIINVPRIKAKVFKAKAGLLKTKIVFDYTDDILGVKNIVLKMDDREYNAIITENSYQPQIVTLNNSLSNSFVDKKIVTLQDKKLELQRKTLAKKRSDLREEKLKEKRESLEKEIALLEASHRSGENDIDKYLKDSKQAKLDSKKWLFIIGIENYEYTDSVLYSTNSANELKKVMKKRLGIPEKNIRTLINRDATSGKIRYNLKDMLAHVKKDDTIYFYYSGHGIPVPAQKNAPYLLAQDMSPDYVADDDRFKLQNIYKSLSNSKASKVVAFIDSCFSGGADNTALIKGVAAARMVPKKVTFDKKKMLVISAGSGTQYSNKFDEKSNRLFSYYLMRALIKNNTSVSRLYDYIKSNVQEKSYEMGSSYEQIPVYDGNIGLKF
ncbi:caspase family protein [Sulfurimonas sp.]|nr:caspase family protein [Sulfurimonas sp.]